MKKSAFAQQMGRLWTQYCTFFEGSDDSELRNPPVDESEFAKLEKEISAKLPEDLKELYRFSDGQSDDLGVLLFGIQWFRFSELVSWREDFPGDPGEYRSVPPGAVKLTNANPKWLPFAHDGGGAFLAVDLDPDKKGTVGQVITCGGAEWARVVLAPSLTDFIEALASKLEAEDYTLIENEDEIYTLAYRKVDDENAYQNLSELYGVEVEARKEDR